MRNISRFLSLAVVVPLAVSVAWFGALPPASAREAVSASRYRQTVTAPSGFPFPLRAVIDGTVLTDFCQDLDGCQVILVNDSFGPTVVSEARLVLSPYPNYWTTSATPGSYSLNSNGVENIVVTNSYDGTCRLSDVDADGSDNTTEFSVVAVASLIPVNCTVTLID